MYLYLNHSWLLRTTLICVDNLISNYQISIRGKKLYTPIIFWIFDAAVSNSWILSKAYRCKLDKLEFIRQLVESLCVTYGTKPKNLDPILGWLQVKFISILACI